MAFKKGLAGGLVCASRFSMLFRISLCFCKQCVQVLLASQNVVRIWHLRLRIQLDVQALELADKQVATFSAVNLTTSRGYNLSKAKQKRLEASTIISY